MCLSHAIEILGARGEFNGTSVQGDRRRDPRGRLPSLGIDIPKKCHRSPPSVFARKEAFSCVPSPSPSVVAREQAFFSGGTGPLTSVFDRGRPTLWK